MADSASEQQSDGDGALPSAALRVRLNPESTVRAAGRWLAGGVPFRLLHLSENAARDIRRWQSDTGDTVGANLHARALARRLLDYGLLLSEGPDGTERLGPDPDIEIDVVVPVHNRSTQFEACLEPLSRGGFNIMVVDDGSADPAGIAEIAARHGARLTRLEENRGPAAARNAGLRGTSGPFVAFVDSDVVVTPGCLQQLLAHFADPLVAIAAPRVLPAHPEQPGWVAGYENHHSVLDLGPAAGNIGPGNHVPYVIGAAMLTRRSAVGSGFVEELRSGEDVDLGWRLVDAGWRLVYDPSAVVLHDHRVRLIPLLARRWTYGRSIGPLAKRHPGALVPLRTSAFTAGALGAAVAGYPAPAGLMVLGRTVLLWRHVRGDCALTASVTVDDLWFTAIGVGRASRRAWSPVLLLLALRSRYATRLLMLALVLRLFEQDQLHPKHLPLALADDLVAALALWSSCAELRILDPLMPRFHS